jgi:hypothetical protein
MNHASISRIPRRVDRADRMKAKHVGFVVGREMEEKEKKPERVLTREALKGIAYSNGDDHSSEIVSFQHELKWFTAITDDAAEMLLSKNEFGLCGEVLDFSGLTDLSDIAAEHLGKLQALELDLSGLTSINDRSAENLSGFGSSLNLSGLHFLSDSASRNLSKCGPELKLNGLTSLSDAAAESLSKLNLDFLHLNVVHPYSSMVSPVYLMLLLRAFRSVVGTCPLMDSPACRTLLRRVYRSSD